MQKVTEKYNIENWLNIEFSENWSFKISVCLLLCCMSITLYMYFMYHFKCKKFCKEETSECKTSKDITINKQYTLHAIIFCLIAYQNTLSIEKLIINATKIENSIITHSKSWGIEFCILVDEFSLYMQYKAGVRRLVSRVSPVSEVWMQIWFLLVLCYWLL